VWATTGVVYKNVLDDRWIRFWHFGVDCAKPWPGDSNYKLDEHSRCALPRHTIKNAFMGSWIEPIAPFITKLLVYSQGNVFIMFIRDSNPIDNRNGHFLFGKLSKDPNGKIMGQFVGDRINNFGEFSIGQYSDEDKGWLNEYNPKDSTMVVPATAKFVILVFVTHEVKAFLVDDTTGLLSPVAAPTRA
jgi:hypothetical protein